MPRRGGTMFTHAAVQRAMDNKAARWGAPPGYYTVVERVRKLSFEEQVWTVRVRLFAGRVTHLEPVVFVREGLIPRGPIVYDSPAEKYRGPGMTKLHGRERRDPVEQQAERLRASYALQAGTTHDAIMKGTQWSQSEDRAIREDAAAGEPITFTARKIGRTYYAVSRRRNVLGVSSRKRPGEAVEGEARV